jgi:NOL1/NOP2/sun family putative RNA methylase
MFDSYNYNPFLIAQYIRALGNEETAKLLAANEKPLTKAIRVNTLLTDVTTCIKRLEEKGFVFSKVRWCSEGYTVMKEPFSIGATPEHLLGYYFVQDPSSMAPAIELSPAENETVLDMAAAPGGKTTHLAQIMGNHGTIVAVDINKDKMRALRSNIQRCGVENAITLRMEANELTSLGIRFDKILLDAPCTGEGTIRKNPERRKTIDEKEVDEYSAKQQKMLKVASSVIKPGGILVYSTCSLLPQEDELQVKYAVEKLGFELLGLKNKFCAPGIGLKQCGRFYPHIHDTQGFFIAKLKKT